MFEWVVTNYNILIVLLAMIVLGAACGITGCFMVLRREALLSDAVIHAALPGIGLGFLLSLYLGYEDGRFLPVILTCAFITAFAGAGAVHYIKGNTRLYADAAIACTMSFFYGLGLLLLSAIQNINSGNKAGLGSFLLGQVAGITAADAMLLLGVSGVSIALILFNFRLLKLWSFDPCCARLLYGKDSKIAFFLILALVLVVCAGMRTVGIILILALLIIPPVAARVLSRNIRTMIMLCALLGAMASVVGVLLSYVYALPTGAMIVLCAFALLVLCLGIKAAREKIYVS